MATSTITSKGQITLPKEVRTLLGVAEGDRLDFVVGKDGSVRVALWAPRAQIRRRQISGSRRW